jgi:hypothetical protein
LDREQSRACRELWMAQSLTVPAESSRAISLSDGIFPEILKHLEAVFLTGMYVHHMHILPYPDTERQLPDILIGYPPHTVGSQYPAE